MEVLRHQIIFDIHGDKGDLVMYLKGGKTEVIKDISVNRLANISTMFKNEKPLYFEKKNGKISAGAHFVPA